MTHEEVRAFCNRVYNSVYERTTRDLVYDALLNSKKAEPTQTQKDEIERIAQKEAIKIATIEGLKHCRDVEAALVWRAVYETHIHRKSGINDAETIASVISADQSWKKSSGHAFEEMIKILGSAALHDSGIEVLLQRDLNTLIKAGELANEPRDISWLKEQINASIFDLYTLVNKDDKKYCYGCVQSKTSVRDRVTRDREPSIAAMQSFFWSTIIVLDGDFLKLPKFISMVNGGTPEHPSNGWHGLYVFSEQYSNDRIYATDLDFKNFKEHAIKAAEYWLTQRQWFNTEWRAD